MHILHCSQCHWSDPVATFYASVTESEKGESGAGKKKKKGLSSLFSLLFVWSYLSILMPKELQNDSISQN